METKQEWVDRIMSNWVDDELLNYGYSIALLYSSLDPHMIVEVMTEVKEQQIAYTVRSFKVAEDSPARPDSVLANGMKWVTGSTTHGDGFHVAYTSYWKMLCFISTGEPVTGDKIEIPYDEYINM